MATPGIRSVCWSVFLLVCTGSLTDGCSKEKHSTPMQQPPPGPGLTDRASATAGDWDILEKAVIDPNSYTLIEFPTEQLARHMIPGSAKQSVPANLQGIWWMDGNPLAPGDAVSFATMPWDLANHRVLVQEYEENNYTFDADEAGRQSFQESASENLIFETEFNPTYTFGRLIQVKNGVKSPVDEIDYTMELVAEGDWFRQSTWALQPLPSYHLRRIMTADGQPVEPAFQEFLNIAPRSSLMPRRKR